MNKKENSPTFPYQWPWENFGPSVVTIRALRKDPRYVVRFDAACEIGRPRRDLTRSNIGLIAGALKLDDKRRDRLSDDFCLVASWYMGPEVQKALGIDEAACRRELSRAIKAVSDLRSALRQIDTMVGPTFLHLYARSSADKAAGGLVLFDHLERQLSEVERVAGTLADVLKSKGPGRPGVFLRNTAVALIREALMEAGAAPVTTSHGTGDQAGTHLHFSNESGRALLAIFKLLDYRVDESLLVRSFELLRGKSRKANLPKNSAKGA